MDNEERAERLIKDLGFDFDSIPKEFIKTLLEREVEDFQEGSSEYIRLLCGYLYCLGDETDVSLLKKAKYDINFDVGCMIDEEWITSLENGGIGNEYVRSKEYLMDDFVNYYQNYFKVDDLDDF